MKEPFSWRRLLCRLTGHRLTLERDTDRYGRPYRIDWCGRIRR